MPYTFSVKAIRKILSVTVSSALILTAPGLPFYRAFAGEWSDYTPMGGGFVSWASYQVHKLRGGWAADKQDAAAAKQAAPCDDKVSPDTLVSQLTAAGILQGAEDAAAAYLVDANGALSPLGKTLACYEQKRVQEGRYGRSGFDANVAAQTDKDIQAAFAELRKSPGATTKIAAKRAAIDETAKRLGELGLNDASGAYMAVSQMMAVLTGARQAGGPNPDDDMDVTISRDGTVTYYDDNNRVFAVVDKNQVVQRTREIEELQIEFNKQHIAGAPVLTVTGRNDLATTLSPFWQFRDQMGRFDRAMHYDRTLALAEILHKDKQFHGDQFDPVIQERERRQKVAAGQKDAKTLEEDFQDQYVGGSRYLARQLLDPSFKAREQYLKQAQAALRAFVQETAVQMAGMSAAEADKVPTGVAELEAYLKTLKPRKDLQISAAGRNRIEIKRRMVGLYLTMAFLAGEDFHLSHTGTRLASDDMSKAIADAPGQAAQKAQVEAQRAKFAKRLEAVRGQVKALLAQLSKLSLDLPEGSAQLADVQARLDAAQNFLAEVETQDHQVLDDANTYSTLIGQYTQSKKAVDGNWLVKLTNWGSQKLAPFSDRAQRAATIENGTLALDKAFTAMGQGDFDTVKNAQRNLVADAYKTHWASPLFGSSNGGPATGASEEDKLSASISAYGEMLGQQAEQDVWIGMTGDMLKTAALTAVMAPAMSVTLTKLGTGLVGASLEMSASESAMLRMGAVAARGFGEVALNSGTLLSNLENTKWVPGLLARTRPTTIFTRALYLEAGVAANLGLISGTLSWYKASNAPWYNPWAVFFDGSVDPNSPFSNRGEAFFEGVKGGAQFVTQNPWILYVGLPTTIIGRGNGASRVLSNFGESGLVGGATRTMSNLAKADFDVVARFAGKLGEYGPLGSIGSFGLVTTDQVLKYYVGAEAMGWTVNQLFNHGDALARLWDGNKDAKGNLKELGDEELASERSRLERAEYWTEQTQNWGWLLIPTASATGGSARRDQQLSEDLFREKQATGKLHELVNAEDQMRKLDTQARSSALDIIFGRHQDKGPAGERYAKVTREMEVRATREVLDQVAPTIEEKFKISQIDATKENVKIGPEGREINVTDKVQNQALSGFKSQVQQNPVEALKLLEKLKAANENPALQQAIVESVHSGSQGGPVENLLRAAEVQLQLSPQGSFAERVAKVTETRLFNRMRAGDGFYTGLVKSMKSMLPLTEASAAKAAILKEAEGLLAEHSRTKEAGAAKNEAFRLSLTKLTDRGGAHAERLEQLNTRFQEWFDAQEQGKQTQDARTLLNDWNKEVQGDSRLSQESKDAMHAMVEANLAVMDRLEQAPVYNAKGTRIKSLRPKQQALAVEFYTSLLSKRSARATVRKYLRLATGGGKTLLAAEVILPFAQADAKAKGKKLAYVTANSTLVAQARVDFNAFKRLDDIEIISADELTTRLAKGRFMGGDRAADYWLIVDELDKMAEDAVKTIGQESARVTRENDAYRGMNNISEKLEGLSKIVAAEPNPGFLARLKRAGRALVGDGVGQSLSAGEISLKAKSDIDALVGEHADLLRDADVDNGASKVQLKTLAERMGAAARNGEVARTGALAKQYRGLLERSVESSNPVYGVYESAWSDIQRWMDSPLRKSDPARWEKTFEKQLDRMTKDYAGRFEKAVNASDMTPAEKGKLLSGFEVSKKTGKGWVYNELVNLAYGYLEDPATVRYDGQAKRVHIVHPEWFENMDTPTRRRWELAYGTDLTLPYEHRAKATIKDLTSNKDLNITGLSGTLQDPLELVGMEVLGKATERQAAKDRPFVNESAMTRNILSSNLKNRAVEGKLSFNGFSNTRDLKLMRKALIRAGVAPEEIAMVFSDTEYLRALRPKSDVVKQMNLAAMKSGKVKYVLFDMRVGGRGVDLDFASYKDIDMFIVNPDKISPVHYVQFQGRVAKDRVPKGVKPKFYNYLNLEQALRNPEMKEMAAKEGKTLDKKFILSHLEDAQQIVQKELLENSEAISRGKAYWRTGLHGLTK